MLDQLSNLHCSKSFLSFFFDKVTTGTYNFVSFTSSLTFAGEEYLRVAVIAVLSKLVITQFLLQVKINSISQLIDGIPKVLQKLLKYLKELKWLINILQVPLVEQQFFCIRFVCIISRIINFITFCIGNSLIDISTPCNTCFVFKRF